MEVFVSIAKQLSQLPNDKTDMTLTDITLTNDWT